MAIINFGTKFMMHKFSNFLHMPYIGLPLWTYINFITLLIYHLNYY